MSDTSRPPPPKIRAEMLRDVGLFGGLDDETLRVLAEQLPVMTVEPGAAVVDEGDDRQEMFLVIAGELEVVKRGRGGEFRVALFGPGDCFGEMSLIDVQPQTTSELMEALTGLAVDAPLCMTCGTKMRPSGSCYVCEGCGATSGCS